MERVISTEAAAGRRRDHDVLEAAISVFHRRGYATATVQDVADEMQILKGSLYHYIRTKEDLLFLVFKSVHADVDKIIDDTAALSDLSPLGRLNQYIRRQVIYTAEHMPAMSVYYNDMDSLTDERLDEVIASRNKHEGFVRKMLNEAQKAGDIASDVNPKYATPCIFASIIWTYRWYQPSGPLRPEQLADQIARFAIHGLDPE